MQQRIQNLDTVIGIHQRRSSRDTTGLALSAMAMRGRFRWFILPTGVVSTGMPTR